MNVVNVSSLSDDSTVDTNSSIAAAWTLSMKLDVSALEARDTKGGELLNIRFFSAQLLKETAHDVIFDNGEKELEHWN